MSISHKEDIPYSKNDPQKLAEMIGSDNKEHGESDSSAGCSKFDTIIVTLDPTPVQGVEITELNIGCSLYDTKKLIVYKYDSYIG